ncbi:uncharacterized protein LOC142348454 [Convolutriloba macropyga]|uniref:uncharacterized protein LOC142348454 n=1 Tax=Convolutriloba macropyga TaxID=536237 RepID=UPI003F51AE4C
MNSNLVIRSVLLTVVIFQIFFRSQTRAQQQDFDSSMNSDFGLFGNGDLQQPLPPPPSPYNQQMSSSNSFVDDLTSAAKRLAWGDRRLMVKSRSFPYNARYFGGSPFYKRAAESETNSF